MKRCGNRYRVTEEVQQQIVREYETTDLSRQELAIKYNIGVSTLDAYRRRWSCKEE